jgi:hypothetical protein
LSLFAAAVSLLSAGAAWFLLPESAFELAAGGLGFYLIAFAAQVFLSRTAALARWLRARPEAQLFANDAQRAAVLDDIARRVAGTGRFAIAAVLAILTGFTLALAIARYGMRWLGPLVRLLPFAALVISLLPLVLPLLVLLTYPLLWRRRAHRQLREQLVALGIGVCLKRGYNLTGNVSGRCPECGTEVRPPARGGTAHG